MQLNAEDSFGRAIANMELPPISDMDTWVNDIWDGGLKARAASVLGRTKPMTVDGGSAQSSARDSARLLDVPANMVASSPRLMELMGRIASPC